MQITHSVLKGWDVTEPVIALCPWVPWTSFWALWSWTSYQIKHQHKGLGKAALLSLFCMHLLSICLGLWGIGW